MKQDKHFPGNQIKKDQGIRINVPLVRNFNFKRNIKQFTTGSNGILYNIFSKLTEVYMNAREIRETAGAFQKSRIILTAFELDIFTFLAEKSYSAKDISKAIDLDERAAEKLLNALTALNLLEKENEKFKNTAESFKYLSKSSPEYMSGLGHSNHLWDTWSQLTDVVKEGEPAHEEEINERGDEWLNAFIHAMHYRGKIQAPAHVSKIDLDNVGSVLDVGGGSGVFLMSFLERKPELKAAVFDLPNVLPISKKIVKEEGYEGKIEHYEGDFTKDELPKGFDMIFLSAIIHGNSYDTNKDLVKKCHKALNSKGKIVIQDWIMDDSKTKPVQGALFSINMLVGVEGGDCYSESEVKSWLDNAGFTNMKITGLEAGLGQVVAEKE